MPRYACPNCESEDLKASDLATVTANGQTVIVCTYCTEGTSIVAGAAGPRFTPFRVIELIGERHGDYARDLDAFVHVSYGVDESEAEIKLTSNDDTAAERFRVRVTRIEGAS